MDTDDAFAHLPHCFRAIIDIDRQLAEPTIDFLTGVLLVKRRREQRRLAQILLAQPAPGNGFA